VPGHAGATHDHDIGAILIAKLLADGDHLCQRPFPRGGLGHAHVEGPLAGEAAEQPQLTQIAQMTPDRPLGYGDDTEPLATCQGRQHPRLIDAEHGSAGGLAANMQTGIGITGDHEGVDVVAARHQPAQRQGDTFHVFLRLDAVRSLAQGRTGDLRPILELDRCQSLGQPCGHDLVAVWVHHQNAPAIARDHAGVLQRLPPLLAGARSPPIEAGYPGQARDTCPGAVQGSCFCRSHDLRGDRASPKAILL